MPIAAEARLRHIGAEPGDIELNAKYLKRIALRWSKKRLEYDVCNENSLF
jgi:hypothetical protein